MEKIKLFLIFFAFITFSCTKHEINLDDNKEFPLQFEIKPVANTVELSWESTKITNFQEYRVTRQLDSITFNTATDTTWIIDDYNKTKVIDRNIPLAGKIFYKLIAKSANLTLKSKTLALTRKDIISFPDISFNTISFNPEKNLIYVLNRFPSDARVINLDKGTMSKTYSFDIQSSTNPKYLFYPELPNDFFVVDLTRVLRYDANTFELKHQFEYQSSTTSDIVANNNLIYMTQSNQVKGVDIFDTQKNAFVYQGTLSFTFSSSRFLRYLPNQKRIIMLENFSSSKQAVIFHLNDDGIVKGTDLVTKTNAGSLNGLNSAVSPTGNSLIIGGFVYDKDLNLLFTLSSISSPNSIPNFCYSPDGKYLAYRTNSNAIKILDATTFKEVYNYKLSFSTVSGQPRFNSFYITNDKLNVIATRQNLNTFLNEIMIFRNDFR